MESLPYEKEAYVQSINLFLAVDTPIVADVSSYKGNFKKKCSAHYYNHAPMDIAAWL